MYTLFDHQDAGVLSKAKLVAQAAARALPLAVPDLTSGRASHSITFKEPGEIQDGRYTTCELPAQVNSKKKAVALRGGVVRTRADAYMNLVFQFSQEWVLHHDETGWMEREDEVGAGVGWGDWERNGRVGVQIQPLALSPSLCTLRCAQSPPGTEVQPAPPWKQASLQGPRS